MPTVVWDLQVRLFHWSLVAFFVAAYLLEGNWRALHTHLGYTVLLLVTFRLIWGAIGSTHARFSDFLCSPVASVQHLLALWRGNATRHRGHDPAGALMIVALLLAITITGLSGMTLYGMEGNGPLAGRFANLPGGLLERVHELAADTTTALVCIHIAGVFFTSYRLRENLVGAMISGRKTE